jgi:hypothetical protein
MAKPNWIEYSPDSTTRENVRKNLTGVRIDFGGSKPNIKDGIFTLPREGAVCPIDHNRFVLRNIERIEVHERGYWVGEGTPGYGQEWLSSSDAQYLDDDDRFLLGRERMLPPDYRYEREYFYGGNKRGTLFLNNIDDELAKELVNDIDAFVSKVEK